MIVGAAERVDDTNVVEVHISALRKRLAVRVPAGPPTVASARERA